MKKFISFPKIGQFNQIIKNVIHAERYDGQDENDEAVYNLNREPIVKFTGTVKLHGTNSSVVFNSLDGMWTQSRNNIITPEKDNAGFSTFVYSKQVEMQELINKVVEREDIDTTKNNVCIYGEWCGGSVQKGVALNNLEKMMVIFAVKIAPFDEDQVNYWVDHSGLSNVEHKIYNSSDFQTFEIDIDFANPKMIQNKLVDLTMEVEKCCPVGKSFGVEGIGEGIVWKCDFKGNQYLFKTKGEKHSSSNTKSIAPVDTEKLENINAFVEYACTENRLNQMLENTFTMENKEPNIKEMGLFLKNVMSDIVKEEMDAMIKSNLEPKMVGKSVSTKARMWFMKYLDEQVGL